MSKFQRFISQVALKVLLLEEAFMPHESSFWSVVTIYFRISSFFLTINVISASAWLSKYALHVLILTLWEECICKHLPLETDVDIVLFAVSKYRWLQYFWLNLFSVLTSCGTETINGRGYITTFAFFGIHFSHWNTSPNVVQRNFWYSAELSQFLAHS